MQKEIEYNFVSTQGSVNQSTLDGWESYLQQFRDYIIKGTHFSNFAVQARERGGSAAKEGVSLCVWGHLSGGSCLLLLGQLPEEKLNT